MDIGSIIPFHVENATQDDDDADDDR